MSVPDALFWLLVVFLASAVAMVVRPEPEPEPDPDGYTYLRHQ